MTKVVGPNQEQNRITARSKGCRGSLGRILGQESSSYTDAFARAAYIGGGGSRHRKGREGKDKVRQLMLDIRIPDRWSKKICNMQARLLAQQRRGDGTSKN